MSTTAHKADQELTVEEKLRALYTLQTIDSKTDEIHRLCGELPLEVQDLEDEIEGLTTRVERMRNQVEELQREVSGRRINIEKNNSDIARYKEQQNNVRNNREYDNLSKEIEYQELDIELSQKKIRTLTADLEQLQQDKAKTITQIEEKTVDLEQKRNELDSILSETKVETETLMVRSGELERGIDERLLMAFKRIRKNAHNGLAVVKVERDSCGGCHSKIPAQRQLDIRQRKKIIVCEFCGRILVDPDMEVEKKGRR